jgi:hypothetical protein
VFLFFFFFFFLTACSLLVFLCVVRMLLFEGKVDTLIISICFLFERFCLFLCFGELASDEFEDVL